jgi:hypothetical protein
MIRPILKTYDLTKIHGGAISFNKFTISKMHLKN